MGEQEEGFVHKRVLQRVGEGGDDGAADMSYIVIFGNIKLLRLYLRRSGQEAKSGLTVVSVQVTYGVRPQCYTQVPWCVYCRLCVQISNRVTWRWTMWEGMCLKRTMIGQHYPCQGMQGSGTSRSKRALTLACASGSISVRRVRS